MNRLAGSVPRLRLGTSSVVPGRFGSASIKVEYLSGGDVVNDVFIASWHEDGQSVDDVGIAKAEVDSWILA